MRVCAAASALGLLLLLLLIAGNAQTSTPTPPAIPSLEALKALHSQMQNRLDSASAALGAFDARAPHGPAGYTNTHHASLDFSLARDRRLSDVDIWRFIDPRIPLQNRLIAFRIMKAQAPSRRENVFEMNGSLVIANAWEDYWAGVIGIPIPLGDGLFRSRIDGHVFRPI